MKVANYNYNSRDFKFIEIPSGSQYFELDRWEQTGTRIVCRDVSYNEIREIDTFEINLRKSSLIGKASYIRESDSLDILGKDNNQMKKFLEENGMTLNGSILFEINLKPQI